MEEIKKHAFVTAQRKSLGNIHMVNTKFPRYRHKLFIHLPRFNYFSNISASLGVLTNPFARNRFSNFVKSNDASMGVGRALCKHDRSLINSVREIIKCRIFASPVINKPRVLREQNILFVRFNLNDKLYSGCRASLGANGHLGPSGQAALGELNFILRY